MSYTTSFYYGYGILVADEHDSYALQDELGGASPVFHLPLGDVDADRNFLFIREATPDIELLPGSYASVPPYSATAEQYSTWDWQLVDTAQKHGLKIIDGPSWFFVPDRS